MDPTEILTVRFHIGGEFVRIGHNLQYVGGDEEMSEIERDKLSLQEVIGHLKDHMQFKESMKIYFHVPGKPLADGLQFLSTDSVCVQMGEYICVGGVADLYVEYHGEEDSGYSSSGSDFEDELKDMSDGDGPDIVITAENSESSDDDQILHNIMVPDGTGVITQVISSPLKKNSARTATFHGEEVPVSQVVNPTQAENIEAEQVQAEQVQAEQEHVVSDDSVSDSDPEYMPHSEDSGENSEVVEMRRHARKFKKRMRDTKSWISMDASTAIPIDLIANMEQQIGEEEKDWGYDSSEEDYSYSEDSDGQTVRRKTKYPKYNPDTEIPHFELTMVFRSKNQLVKALKRYGIASKKSIEFVKSEATRVRAKCGFSGCNWMLYAAKTSRSDRFQIITHENEHHCAPNRDNRLITAKVIASRYEHFILANPMWKIESMKATVLQDLFADVSTSKCKHAKKLVMEKLLSGMKNEYTRVFDYQLELLRSNPGSTIAVRLDPTILDQNIFHSFYVCFDALKKGFQAGCRRVIGLDGCFFKGVMKGELLCAVARDANNQMYPLAWAIVDMETNETWKWFVGMLIKDLNINNSGDGWVFISDQQKGLINAMKDNLPKAEHRMCARHIYANWRKKHRSHEWQKKFWAVAKACNLQDFNYYKAKLAQESPEGVKDMMRTEPEHWCRAYFPIGSKCESVDNNLCEAFNHAIVDARFYPAISMLEKIRKKVFVRIQEQRGKGVKFHGKICPSIFKKLKASIERTQFMEVLWNGKDGYEVKLLTGRKRQYTVSLEKRTCSCGYFQLSGLPCSHAITAIYKSRQLVEDFIDPCYSIDVYNSIYDHCLLPVEGEEMWPISANPRPQAPGYVKMPGRPKKNDRRREDNEKPKPTKKMTKVGTIIVCSMCGNPGHNKSGCSMNPERGKKKNAHLTKTTKKRKKAEAGTSSGPSQAAPTPQPSSAPTTQPRPAPTPQTRPAPTTQPRATNFRPPRMTKGTNEASTSGAKKKRRPASSIPSFGYFTASGNV